MLKYILNHNEKKVNSFLHFLLHTGRPVPGAAGRAYYSAGRKSPRAGCVGGRYLPEGSRHKAPAKGAPARLI